MNRYRETRPRWPRFDVAGTGFAVLDRVYVDGALQYEALGGSCGNVLISLAMLSRKVAPILRIGADSEGARLIKEFANAGASTEFISRCTSINSPVLAEIIDRSSAEHSFSFSCPDTKRNLPRYQTIDYSDAYQARSAISNCAIFYADRVSPAIVEAMRSAAANGAVIVFEPSGVSDQMLFRSALSLATIFKCAADRFPNPRGFEAEIRRFNTILIVTHGQRGLEIRDGRHSIWCDAIKSTHVKDTCGAGDMVSVAVIDWLLKCRKYEKIIEVDTLTKGVIAGQRLAAENCCYEGARGIFHSRGSRYVRALLDSAPNAALAH